MNNIWGFLRETEEKAIKAGIDKETGVVRTGLLTYLRAIYPGVNDWVHDDLVPHINRKVRPDFRSEQLKLIVEVDGLPHYQKPHRILSDEENNQFYRNLGYTVVRIPYFIQLSRKAIKVLFNVDLDYELFDERIPSMGPKNYNTPAYLCPMGIKRMAKEFKDFPEQYDANIKYLKFLNNEILTGVSLLEEEYNNIQ